MAIVFSRAICAALRGTSSAYSIAALAVHISPNRIANEVVTDYFDCSASWSVCVRAGLCFKAGCTVHQATLTGLQY